jgi:hypothetical protein
LGKEFFEDGNEFLGNLEKSLGMGWGGDSDGIPKNKINLESGAEIRTEFERNRGAKIRTEFGKMGAIAKSAPTRIYTLLTVDKRK